MIRIFICDVCGSRTETEGHIPDGWKRVDKGLDFRHITCLNCRLNKLEKNTPPSEDKA